MANQINPSFLREITFRGIFTSPNNWENLFSNLDMRSYMQIKDRSPRTWVRENLKIGQVLVTSKSWSLFQISPWGNVYWASVLVFLPRIFQSVKLFVHIFMCSWKKMSGDEEAVGGIVTQLSIGRALCCLQEETSVCRSDNHRLTLPSKSHPIEG